MDLLTKLFTSIRDNIVKFWKWITPPYPFSWTTLFFLSVFSALMAALANSAIVEKMIGKLLVQEIISFCGFVFLILGVAWFLTEHPFKLFGHNLSPWITGFLISFLLFGYWVMISPYWLVVSWPITAATVAISSEFVDPHLKLQFRKINNAARQRMIMVGLSYLIICFWIIFGFSINDWLKQYPSLMAIGEFNDHRNSGFVVKYNLPNPPQTRGQALLKQSEVIVTQAMHEKSWADIERWLVDLNSQPTLITERVMQTQPNLMENDVWEIQPQVKQSGQNYDLFLLAIWKGPGADPLGYYFFKTCRIERLLRQKGKISENKSVQLSEAIGLVTCSKPDGPVLGTAKI